MHRMSYEREGAEAADGTKVPCGLLILDLTNQARRAGLESTNHVPSTAPSMSLHCSGSQSRMEEECIAS